MMPAVKFRTTDDVVQRPEADPAIGMLEEPIGRIENEVGGR
jgi:hypothetical protein